MSDNELSEGGALYITFDAYLDRLRAEEGQKPPAQRRKVPTVRDLAKAIRERHGIKLHEVTLSNLINDNGPLLNKENARLLLDEMWYLGFQPTESDLIKYVPPTISVTDNVTIEESSKLKVEPPDK